MNAWFKTLYEVQKLSTNASLLPEIYTYTKGHNFSLQIKYSYSSEVKDTILLFRHF